MLSRRQFFKRAWSHTVGHMPCLGLGLCVPSARVFAAPEDYSGPLLVTLQLMGAWDVTSFCDPKSNQAGEREINSWSRQADIHSAGPFHYAPIANNAGFFQQHQNNLLVINGVDAQTNSHTTGVLHNWSGRNSAGYPALTALFAAQNAPQLPLAYLNFGGYSETARLIRYTRLDDIASLFAVLSPNVPSWDDTLHYQQPARLARVLAAQQTRLDGLRQGAQLLPRQKAAMDAYYEARANRGGLADFARSMPTPEQRQQSVQVNNEVRSDLLTQMQISLLAMQQGVACSADLVMDGFDTHSDHDQLHWPLLGHLVDALDYFWDYAAQLGIAERITLWINSDFARTPFYNSAQGKDHWPIGSTLLMADRPVWGQRVLGFTDAQHQAYPVHPQTLQRDDVAGIRLYPKHIHQALRNYLGISSALNAAFPLDAVAVNVFDP